MKRLQVHSHTLAILSELCTCQAFMDHGRSTPSKIHFIIFSFYSLGPESVSSTVKGPRIRSKLRTVQVLVATVAANFQHLSQLLQVATSSEVPGATERC